MEQQLIALYLRVCRAYDTEPDLKYQRLSNFRPRFTDEELLTVYLFGHMQGFQQQRRIYDYARRHWRAWFPALPSYQAFNRRLNRLAAAFEHLITEALAGQVAGLARHADRLIDSLPISLAKWPRCAAARVAAGVADQGYCATKRSYYYGVKLHAVALRRPQQLPLPALPHLSRASQHDLTVLRELDPDLGAGYLFGDKAHADAEMKKALAGRGTRLVTPYKRRRGAGDGHPGAVVALRLRGQATVGESLRPADSKNRHPERRTGAFDSRAVRACLRQARRRLLALNL